MSFGAQFLAGQKFAQGLIDTYRDAQQRRELEEISKAQPVSADFLSDDASAKVQAAAADPTQHIGYDVGAKAYMATPKLGEDEMGPAQPKQIATAAPMTELLGKRTPGTMTPDQVSGAKFKAMADVISKSDPIQGMRLQREVKQGERDDKRWEREDRKATEEEEFQKGQQAEFAQTIYGKRMGDYATQVQAYEQYQAKLKSGAAPETLGAPPAMPQRPVYSVGESLADTGRLLAFKASKGKADPAEILQYAERLQKVSDEGYGKALKLAQGGAPLAKVIEQFNQTGSMKLDPAAIVSDEMVKDADGVPSRVIKVRDASGNVQTINALSELDAIGQAENYFTRFDKNRTFSLNERKTTVAERQADIAERRLGALEARQNGGGGSGSGGASGAGAAGWKERREVLGDFGKLLPSADTAATPQEAKDIQTGNARALARADAMFSANAAFGTLLSAPQITQAMELARDPKNLRTIRDAQTGQMYETVSVNGRPVVVGEVTQQEREQPPGQKPAQAQEARGTAGNPMPKQVLATMSTPPPKSKAQELQDAYQAWQAAKPSWFSQRTPTSEAREREAEARYTELLRSQYQK